MTEDIVIEQLLDLIDAQQAEIERMKKQIDDVSELVILLMRNTKLR